MPLPFGEPAPWFTAPTASSPEFVFDTAAGRYVLLLFLPADDTAAEALGLLARRQALFDDRKASAFVVVPDPSRIRNLRDIAGLRWIMDSSGEVARRFRSEGPHWLLLDPSLRSMGSAPIEQGPRVFSLLETLGPPSDHAGVPLHAPVLVAPRIFEPELCEALIDLHRAQGGGAFTGVMRDAGERTVHVMDELKSRRDIRIEDPELREAVLERLQRRLFPLVKLALGFTVTEIERYLVSCYDAEDGGVFRPHRDHTTQGTAHRRFACSLNLNLDFEGGDLRFPEFGTATYRPPLGGAVVFSTALLHEAQKITRGRRYAFLPFFYDAEGAATLAAYEARIAAQEAAV